MLKSMAAISRASDLLSAQEQVKRVFCSDALLDYLQALLAHTRTSGTYVDGLSPRAGLALLAAARAWAWLDGRDHVIPEDVQGILPGVVGHRLRAASRDGGRALIGQELAIHLLQAVPLP
jgi:MoxR-like ATPase